MYRWGILILLIFPVSLKSQSTFPVNGFSNEFPIFQALTNTTLYLDYQTRIDSAVILFQNGIIISAGKANNTDIPTGTIVTDMEGKYIYPSFIELNTGYGLPVKKKEQLSKYRDLIFESEKKGPYGWNEAVKPEVDAVDYFEPDSAIGSHLRGLGFGAAITHQRDGIIRGSGALVQLGSGRPNHLILNGKAAGYFSFDKGNSRQDYPTSHMGAIALVRQSVYDAQWYKNAMPQKQAEYNLSLQALNGLTQLPLFFMAEDKLDILRIANLGREFNLKFIAVGKGTAYQRAEEIMQADMDLVIPLDFPKPLDVRNPFDAVNMPLSEMKHWELAPSNGDILNSYGIDFAYTSEGITDQKGILNSIRLQYNYGFSDTLILKGLTHNPAIFAGAEKSLGSLDPGKLANFIVTSDNLFNRNCEILENWVGGIKHIVTPHPGTELRGIYSLITGLDTFTISLSGKYSQPSFDFGEEDSVFKHISGEINNRIVTMVFSGPYNEAINYLKFTGIVDSTNWYGTVQLGDGSIARWKCRLIQPYENRIPVIRLSPPPRGPVVFPFNGFGWDTLPKPQTVVIKNATVWTNEPEGIIQQDVMIKNGIIWAIGDSLSDENAIIIDGAGKHLTAGIVDEHSHMAISSKFNESSQSVSAEVRVQDVINSEDINIYRQLAGGVTTSHLLHGSANPIGGQTTLIKLRWGNSPDGLKFRNSAAFIKFALGENVKQSKYGKFRKARYPQTRMGVEQVMYESFIKAHGYLDKWDRYNQLNSKQKAVALSPRIDLELQALGEILNGERFITCHSYVQSEINMMMKMADSIGIKINTFTHILEGYKLAPQLKEHNAGASTFSDWWAYKYEVKDAIPYNAAILYKMGLVTAINSDDKEMGRRLNQEAAKTIKYGNLSEEDAWKTVTLNPAKLLQVDHRVGSIKTGKDADLVLWSGNPLSIYSIALKTYIDGILMYDHRENKKRNAWIQKERQRLINLMIASSRYITPPKKPVFIDYGHTDCLDEEKND